MEIMKKLLMLTALTTANISIAATPVTTYGGESKDSPVAVVLSQSLKDVSVPTVELYRSVVDVVESGRYWGAASRREVSNQMPKTGLLNQFAAVPVFDRELLLKAHPPARSLRPGYKSKQKVRNHYIVPVQTMLDTLALKGAVIVDCVPYGKKGVSGCGLYYYDRSEGKIVASSRKYFRTGIKDATRWSYGLVASLAEGMQASVVAKDKSRLNAILQKSEDDERKSQHPLVEFKGFGKTLTGPVGSLGSLPGLALQLGGQEDTYSYGLEGGYAQAMAQDTDRDYLVSEKYLAFIVSAQARSLESLVWDLGLGIGYSVRHVGVELQSAVLADEMLSGFLRTKSVFLQVAPGLMWEVSKTLSFGTQLQATRYVPTVSESNGDLEGSSFNRSSLGLAFRVKGIF
jgi:hypothetical protein